VYVTGKTKEDHIKTLEKVCERLEKCGLRLNLSKCKFLQKKIEVLGYVIDKEGLHKARSKVTAMIDAPRPNKTKELESFLGLIGFYSRFLDKRSEKLKPLYDLQNKKEFSWDKNCEKAFKWLKNELISDKVLAHCDPKKEIILACDASDYGLSAIISHRYKNGVEKPIAYASKKIPKTKLKRAIIDKEAMAIVFGFKRFYQYIFGKEITLRTDNKALEFILGPRKGIPITADNRLQRYAYFLSGYRYKIEHIKSKANANCDALSRLPVDDSTVINNTDFSNMYYFESGTIAFDSKTLQRETRKDKVLNEIVKFVLTEWPNSSELQREAKSFYDKRYELTVDLGCLFWGLRACIPVNMRSLILKELHASHMGIVRIKMYARSCIGLESIKT